MAQILGLPKLSPTMEEGVLVRWTKKEGDKVSPGDLIAEVETDKANMDFNVEDEGVLLKLLVKEGDTVKLGAPVAIIGNAGEDVSALVAQAKSGGGGDAKPAAKPAAKPEPKSAPQPPRQAGSDPDADAIAAADAGPRLRPTTSGAAGPRGAEPPLAPPDRLGPPAPAGASQPAPQSKAAAAGVASAGSAASAGGGARLLASPLAKTLAIELGIDLRTLEGSGPGGRIVERDVRSAAEGGNGHARAAAEPQQPLADDESVPTQRALAVRHARQMIPDDVDGDYTDVPASNMRKRIAARLTEAKRDVPHFYLMRTFDAAPMLGFRERLNALLGDRGKVSVNDLIIKAVALALRRVPDCNASWTGEAIRHYHRVHVGVAVAIEDGLVTPVVRDADQKGIGSIAAEVRDLADRAKHRQLKGHEIAGSTFTVSNLGMFGIERFTAILNPPEAGILAIGTVVDAPVVANGQIAVGKRMTVTMSCDHRVIDGALGAKWLVAFVDLIEHPESLAL
jgi:pyruvate dehydrogenase E2 component (dihydrolipoamide acetyltransferase)